MLVVLASESVQHHQLSGFFFTRLAVATPISKLLGHSHLLGDTFLDVEYGSITSIS
jgi:hypothetical protein